MGMVFIPFQMSRVVSSENVCEGRQESHCKSHKSDPILVSALDGDSALLLFSSTVILLFF